MTVTPRTSTRACDLFLVLLARERIADEVIE
jgi:hypothetical protein